MINSLWAKIKESAYSILPVVGIVVLLNFTPYISIPLNSMLIFVISALILVFAMGLFNLGAEVSMTPMGKHSGTGLVKSGSILILLIATLIIGVLVTIAEPDLSVLAGQVGEVIDKKILIITVGIGVGTFLVIAMCKMAFHKQLSQFLMLFYFTAFAFAALMCELGKSTFLSLSFDSGGVTTGPITVPFLMALGVGVAGSIGGRDASENSFGIVSLCSIGPIIVVMVLSIFAKGDINYSMADYSTNILLENVIRKIIVVFFDVGKAISFILLFFIVLNFSILKFKFAIIKEILIGLVMTYIGLVIFLTTVEIGFLPIGYVIGIELAKAPTSLMLIFGFVVGMAVVLAEPAVQVLNKQVEDVTSGAVTRKSMMMALSIGVGISILLSMIRIKYGFSLLYYLIPGYFVSLGLSLFVPPLYTAIAFDSGGVASGPLTSTFILPMMTGICYIIAGENMVLSLAFGVVAMVALTPLITIQLLGFKVVALKYIKNKIVMKTILTAEDNQIIYFDREGIVK